MEGGICGWRRPTCSALISIPLGSGDQSHHPQVPQENRLDKTVNSHPPDSLHLLCPVACDKGTGPLA